MKILFFVKWAGKLPEEKKHKHSDHEQSNFEGG
jgi:hypothetical protein